MDIGHHAAGVWAPPAPETIVTVPPPDLGAWPPPSGPPVTGPPPRRSGWIIGAACVLVGALALGSLVVAGFLLPLTAYPSRWDPRLAGLAAFVEENRGLRFDHPVHVDFLPEAEFRREVTSDEADLSEQERADLEDFEAVARAVGLVRGDVVLF